MDGIERLAAAAESTSEVDLGIGVVPLNIRGASSVADGVRAAELPPERLLLGIGTSGPGRSRSRERESSCFATSSAAGC